MIFGLYAEPVIRIDLATFRALTEAEQIEMLQAGRIDRADLEDMLAFCSPDEPDFSETNLLSNRVLAELMLQVSPAEYGAPPPPPHRSAAIFQADCLAVLDDRAGPQGDRYQLWHPADAKQPGIDPRDNINYVMAGKNRKNGSDPTGNKTPIAV